MDIGVLADYFVLVVIGVCLCVGYVIKKIDNIPNKIIPLIMLVLGVVINLWLNGWVLTPETVLGGMISGLASTGLYEAFRSFIEKKDNKGEKDEKEDIS